MPPRGIQRFYDRHAAARREWWAGMLDVEHEVEARYRDRQEKRTLARLLPRRRYAVAIELGCGAGRWLPFLAERARRAVGVDLSLTILAQARRSCAPAAATVALVAGDVACVPLRGAADLVYLSSVSLYLDDAELEKLADWCARVVPPGGVLVSRDSVSTGARFARDGDYCAVYRTAGEYASVFGARGFSSRAEAPCYLPLRRPAALARRLPRRLLESLIVLGTLRPVDRFADALARLGGRPAQGAREARVAHRFVVYERRS